MNAAGYGGPRPQLGYEAPACVQNAMMTKDKKPFTYTPGGIDLSQIKSERMAKRLARNAQAEGAATGIAQQNRPTPPVSTGTTPTMNVGAAAMGVPFQVLPPPPPPSTVGGKQQNSFAPAPPPPPPPAGTKLAPPNSNNIPANGTRKSPTPQRFEPPPMGFRPEIKIPPNPMASLRKVAPPIEKNTFWKDEYVKERSKSPLVSESGLGNSQQNDANCKSDRLNNYNSDGIYNDTHDSTDGFKASVKSALPTASGSITNERGFPQTSPYTTSTPTLVPTSQLLKNETRNIPQPQSPVNTISYMQQFDSPSTDGQKISMNQHQPKQISSQEGTAPGTSQINKVPMPELQPQPVPWRTQRNQNMQQQNRGTQPLIDNIITQKQQPSPTFDFSTQQNQYQENLKPTSVGSLYIAPITPPKEPSAAQFQEQQKRNSPTRQATSQPKHQQQQTMRQPARWMTSQPPPREQAEWVHSDDNSTVAPSSLQHLKSPPPPQANTSQPTSQTQFGNQVYNMPKQNFGSRNNTQIPTGLHLQINNVSDQRCSPKERIIPITMESTPTNVPLQPNFNPASPGYIMRSPNQFVDQGYNSFPHNLSTQHQQFDPRMNVVPPNHATGVRIIPIAIERNGNEVIHHPSPSTIVLPNDQRTPPIQSKSFRVLQKITDTTDEDTHCSANNGIIITNNCSEPQLQRPQFARQMSAQQARNCPPLEPMHHLQIGQHQDNTYANRLPELQHVHTNIDLSKSHIQKNNQKINEPKLYSGSAIPSRSFKILQAMTVPENADFTEMTTLETLKLNKNGENNEKRPQLLESQCQELNNKTDKKHSAESVTLMPDRSLTTSPSIDPFNTDQSFVKPPYPFALPWFTMPPNTDVESSNWCYPHPMPSHQGPFPDPSNNYQPQQEAYTTYPFYYPYYLPHYPHPPYYMLQSFDKNPTCLLDPYSGLVYPVAPSQSQSSNSSCASSVLPDITITPSTDDTPSQIILNHNIKINKPNRTNRSNFVEIKEIDPEPNNNIYGKHNGPEFTQQPKCFQDKSKSNFNSCMHNEKQYSGENVKEFGEKSPIDNVSPLPEGLNNFQNDIHKMSYETESDTLSETETENRNFDLPAIKSMANLQIYQETPTDINLFDHISDETESETSADEESDIFDEEIETEEVICAEESDIEECDTDEFLNEEDLSIIYEEESDVECCREQTKITLNSKNNIINTATEGQENERNDHVHMENQYNNEDSNEDENSVTVRLPLKFSFKDDNNIATVEIGKSEIKEIRSNKYTQHTLDSLSSESKDEIENSNLNEEKPICNRTDTNIYKFDDSITNSLKIVDPLFEKRTPLVKTLYSIESTDIKDNSDSTFSLNCRNKFMKQTISDDVTNNIADLAQENSLPVTPVIPLENFDFFTTLKETKMQAEKMMEHSTNYWGRSQENRLHNTTNSMKENLEVELLPKSIPESKQEEDIDFWSEIEKPKEEDHWNLAEKTVHYDGLICENIEIVDFQVKTLHVNTESLPQAQEVVREVISPSEQNKSKDILNRINQENSYLWSSSYDEKPTLNSSSEEFTENLCAGTIDMLCSPTYASNKTLNNDIKSVNKYHSIQYPSEPREVDTDEEIDFWAEIEDHKSKGNDEENTDDISFYRAANFWVNRERQNSIDETPYRPILQKPFPAKLPDEPAAINVDVWATDLEEARGEEPLIINPSDTFLKTQDHISTTNITMEPANEIDFWAQINGMETDICQEEKNTEKSSVEPQTPDFRNEKEDLLVKRNNYRKAMSFFKTSIDENNKKEIQNRQPVGTQNEKIHSIFSQIDSTTRPIVLENKKTDSSPPPTTCSDGSSTPTNMEEKILLQSLPTTAAQLDLNLRGNEKLETNLLSNCFSGNSCENVIENATVRDRISAFECGSLKRCEKKTHSLSVECYTPKSSLSRNSSTQRSESEMEEDDSGVTDMNRQLSETDTESESFPELRKMTSYQRAATHSRLFKLLQDENDLFYDDNSTLKLKNELQLKPSRQKIVHNVSITRKLNPNALADAETMIQRRERLSLPLQKNISIDADNPSTPNSPASPIVNRSTAHQTISDKLVNELVQSLLLKSDNSHLKKISMSKLQAAAKRVLEEELDSLERTTLDSATNDLKHDKSYTDYYKTWSDASTDLETKPIVGKSFRALPETNHRSPWLARCPRLPSSNKLTRVTESPEIPFRST